MSIIDIIAAFFVGALSGMGIGGGGLLVIYLTLVRAFPQINAQGINLYFFIFASASALFVHFSKRRIDLEKVLILAITGMPAALMGSILAREANPDLLRRLFGIMLIIGSAASLFSVLFRRKNEKK